MRFSDAVNMDPSQLAQLGATAGRRPLPGVREQPGQPPQQHQLITENAPTAGGPPISPGGIPGPGTVPQSAPPRGMGVGGPGMGAGLDFITFLQSALTPEEKAAIQQGLGQMPGAQGPQGAGGSRFDQGYQIGQMLRGRR